MKKKHLFNCFFTSALASNSESNVRRQKVENIEWFEPPWMGVKIRGKTAIMFKKWYLCQTFLAAENLRL